MHDFLTIKKGKLKKVTSKEMTSSHASINLKENKYWFPHGLFEHMGVTNNATRGA